MASKDWRGFASDFAGPGEIRFEDFEGHKGTTGDTKGLVTGLSRTWDGQVILDESSRQEKLQTLRRKLKDQQDRQKKADERRRQRDLSMAEGWQKHAEERKAEKEKERKERLQALDESQKRAKEAQAQRLAEQEAAEAKAAADARTQEAENDLTFLTGLSTAKAQEGAQAEDQEKTMLPSALAPPTEERKQKASRKPRLPSEATPSRNKKEHEKVVDKTRDKSSVVQQLPQLFPGLRGTAEGKQILKNAEPTQTFEKQPITKEHLLRKAQIKLMDQLAAQVSDYRKSMRSKFSMGIAPSLGLGFNDPVGSPSGMTPELSPAVSGRGSVLSDMPMLSPEV